MKHEPGIFEQPNPEAEAASVARARADVAAGRTYSNEKVTAWLKTWGTPEFKPFEHQWPM